MMYLLITYTLHKDPGEKTSKAGKEYASALLRVGEGSNMVFVNLKAFGDEAAALLALTMGDGVSVQGKLDVGVYEARDGTHKPSLSVMASALMPLRRNKPKPPTQQAVTHDPHSRQERCAGRWSEASGDPSDDIDF